MTGYCGGCRSDLRPGAAFCTACGRSAVAGHAPPPQPGTPQRPAPIEQVPPWPTGYPGSGASPPRRRNKAPSVAAVSGVLIVCVVIGTILLLRAPAATTGPAAAAPPAPTAPTSVAVRVPAPADDLRDQVARDRDDAEQIVGYWVPQVSSKAVGLVDDTGTTYGPQEILDDFRRWRSRFPDVILVQSDDYSSFRTPGYWVTLVPYGYSTAAEANDWCDAQQLSEDDCFAKRLSHTDPPPGNTVPR